MGLQAAYTWTPDHWFDKPRSPRIANYRIEAALDWDRKVLTGKETITWRNAGQAPTSEFPVHLYLNAFKGPQTCFFRESDPRTLKGRALEDASSWGYCHLSTVTLGGQALGGHFGEDESVYWIRLPRMVQPGETIQVELSWEDRFPRIVARSGWEKGDSPASARFLMGAQWFPKVGVYQGDTWNCHAYHANTEFFSDFGTYDVELSLPNLLLLAHTGTQVNFKDASDITKDPRRKFCLIWKLHAEDVIDFAWAAMNSRNWDCERFDYRGTQVFCFRQPEHLMNWDRQRMAIHLALRQAGDLLYPYPYPVLSVLDLPDEAKEADGMEYPTLVTASSITFDPLDLRASPEGVVVHEIGHQWFAMTLASNEVEEPWMDEGFTSWFTRKTMERGYWGYLSTRRFQVGTDALEVVSYLHSPSTDPMSRMGHLVRDRESYFVSAYAKPTLVLDQLEAMVGSPMMEQILQAYATEMAFRHPTGRDFKRIAEKVSGRDLSAFWHAFVEGTDTLDFVISQVQSQDTLAGGWMESPGGEAFAAPQPQTPGRRGSITLERRGGLRLPITLWVRLEDRTESRLTWDGQDRWVTYEFESPVVAAVLDPDGNYPMLVDRLHAAYAARPTRRGFHYWSQLVWASLTGLLQTVGLG
jgi:hypothetical protein